MIDLWRPALGENCGTLESSFFSLSLFLAVRWGFCSIVTGLPTDPKQQANWLWTGTSKSMGQNSPFLYKLSWIFLSCIFCHHNEKLAQLVWGYQVIGWHNMWSISASPNSTTAEEQVSCPSWPWWDMPLISALRIWVYTLSSRPARASCWHAVSINKIVYALGPKEMAR